MKGLKNVALFVGGTTVGFLCGGVFVVLKALQSDCIRNALKNVLTNKIIFAIFGEDAQTTRRPSTVSYHDYYTSRHRPAYDFNSDDVVFETRKAADEALEQLNKTIETYGFATVEDLKGLAEVASSYIDHKYGWTDLSGVVAVVDKTKNGYILKLPKCMLID